MDIPKIHEGEYRFCLILWKHEPVTAAQLAKLCQEQLGWKRTTTYKRFAMTGIEASPGFEITNPNWIANTPHEAPPTRHDYMLT